MNPEEDSGPGSLQLPPEWLLRVGHDLRGPIGPMRMAVQMLRSGRLDLADQEATLNVLDRQLELLLGSIDDVSDLIRIGAGKFVYRAMCSDLNLVLDLISGRSSLLRALVEKSQTLDCVATVEPLLAHHDPRCLASLLDYLIRRVSLAGATGAALRLELSAEPGRACFLLGGTQLDLTRDPELAHVLGVIACSAGELEAKPILMREIARRAEVTFSTNGDKSGISFWLPAPD